MTYTELLKIVETLKAQGKEPHGLLREMLINYQLNQED
jgi:hypothetical protein